MWGCFKGFALAKIEKRNGYFQVFQQFFARFNHMVNLSATYCSTPLFYV